MNDITTVEEFVSSLYKTVHMCNNGLLEIQNETKYN